MTLGKGGTNCGVLKKCFDLQGKEIVSIVGSGGKTSLMWALAKHIEKKLFWLVQPQKLGFPNVNCMIIFIRTILKNNAEYLRNHFSRNRYQQPNKTNNAAMTSFQTLFQHFTKVFRSGWVQTTTFERLVLL